MIADDGLDEAADGRTVFELHRAAEGKLHFAVGNSFAWVQWKTVLSLSRTFMATSHLYRSSSSSMGIKLEQHYDYNILARRVTRRAQLVQRFVPCGAVVV